MTTLRIRLMLYFLSELLNYTEVCSMNLLCQRFQNKCYAMSVCSFLYTISRITHTCLEFYINKLFSNVLEINSRLARNYYFTFFIIFNNFTYLIFITLIALKPFLSILNIIYTYFIKYPVSV